MAQDLIHGYSPAELKKEIDELVKNDVRSLPPKAKTFAAIAKLQKFDTLPELSDAAKLDAIPEGAVEINRGISPTKGVPAMIYAQDLLCGPMYPGTLSAYGNGLYFAEPGMDCSEPQFAKKISRVAVDYALGDEGESLGVGAVIRAFIKPGSNIHDRDDMTALFRDHRNRALRAGITDAGSFAAALGFDGYFVDGCYDHTEERVWVVVNRGALIFQKLVIQVSRKGS